MKRERARSLSVGPTCGRKRTIAGCISGQRDSMCQRSGQMIEVIRNYIRNQGQEDQKLDELNGK